MIPGLYPDRSADQQILFNAARGTRYAGPAALAWTLTPYNWQ